MISKDGMSFNKISPVYRELLMKLAMSMSGDEMFIRSKNIMMQEKVKKNNESTISRVLQVFKGKFDHFWLSAWFSIKLILLFRQQTEQKQCKQKLEHQHQHPRQPQSSTQCLHGQPE